MKISKLDPNNLLIKDTPLYPGIICLPWGLFALYKLIQHIYGRIVFDEQFFGLLANVVITLVATGVMNQFRIFHFKIGERRLYWRRIGLFGYDSGTVSFSHIKKAVFESSLAGFRNHATLRLALVTTNGTIPMTHYGSGTAFKAECESAAAMIHSALGKDHGKFIEDSILELVSAGKRIQAARLAIEHYKFSLTEAMKFIQELKP